MVVKIQRKILLVIIVASQDILPGTALVTQKDNPTLKEANHGMKEEQGRLLHQL